MRRAVVFALAAAIAVGNPAYAQEEEEEAFSGRRLILEPAEAGTIFTIEGLYPQPSGGVCAFKGRPALRTKYRGRIEILRQTDGRLRIINELSFGHYLRGIAEVPLSWPQAALRAQVIAARSYALDAYLRGRAGAEARGYHICATDQCQVYRGATVELGAFGERWVDAVRATRRQVLTHGGRVIQAFYFSTSDGRTRRSFPGGTPQPWLPSVAGEDDDAPLGRWRAPLPLGHLASILAVSEGSRAALWPGGRIERVREVGDEVRISGARQVVVPKAAFRSHLNAFASCLYPDAYPNPAGSQGGGRLPLTVPSSSYSLEQDGRRVVLTGRGWGHFVGMSQWGAHSLAQRGRSARTILNHYYGPATVERVDEPSSIRVLAAEGMRRVRIAVEGEARASTDTGSELAPGTAFEIRGGDGLSIMRERGPRLRGVLEAVPRTESLRVASGGETRLGFDVSRAARITVSLHGPGGVEHVLVPETSFERGRGRVTFTVPAALEPGTYQAMIEAYDGLDRVRSPVTIEVLGEPLAGTVPVEPGGRNRFGVLLLAAAVLGAVLAGGAIAVRLSRR